MKNIKTNRLDKEKLIEYYKKNGNAVKTGLEFGVSGPTVLMHAYPNYGGRGITVCDRWREPYGVGCKNYIEDIHEILGSQPSINHSLDRINNDGPYAITNLRWATKSEQQKNQRRSKSKE